VTASPSAAPVVSSTVQESSSAVGASPSAAPFCHGDFNGSGRVDMRDLLGFVRAYNKDCLAQPCYGDFNGSGRVDMRDLLGFVRAYNKDCP